MFFEYIGTQPISKENTIAYKEYLCEKLAAVSVNSMLAALNHYLRFLGRLDSCVKPLKIQRRIFCDEEKELTRTEYLRLLQAAKNQKNQRLSLVIQTICGTGIRVSELRFITVEAVQAGKAVVSCKNKTRVIFIPAPLQKLLTAYYKNSGLKDGTIFLSKNGKPLDRSNIWREMKSLCAQAGVSPHKVFPHNLRHLFARSFYAIDRDIVRLADLLGHSSINTTRIYVMETGREHVRQIARMQLIVT